MDHDIFHQGELDIQERAGVRESARQTGRMIRDHLFAGTHAFIENQRMVLCASLDNQGDIWASLLQGNPGFLHVADERTLEIRLDPMRMDWQDPLLSNLVQKHRMGLLLIEPDTRRRLRINGTVTRIQSATLTLTVHACYPNCPKYIQQRQSKENWIESAHQDAREGSALTPEVKQALTTTDTLFVASAHPGTGADISHRGGHPGFVQVLDDTTLRIPDYAGNHLFNTLGNFHAYPHAGILVPDFDSGRTIQLIGTPRILWHSDTSPQEDNGAQRYWEMRISHWRIAAPPVHLQWKFVGYSPYLPGKDKPHR